MFAGAVEGNRQGIGREGPNGDSRADPLHHRSLHRRDELAEAHDWLS